MSTFFFPREPQRSILLWRAFWRALQPLRPSCARTTTFLWLVVVLAALCLRPDLAGVTSLVRGLGLSEASYYGLLHFFHSPALDLEQLTRLWQQTLQRLFRRRLVRVNGRAVVLVDGLKRPKEGKRMPGVKSLHQESRCNAKASFIMGHSLQAVAVLAQAAGVYLAVPVAARIHEGVVWSNRDRRTLLDKLAALLAGLPWNPPVTVVADAYYAAAKFARSLLADGHHLVTRVRTTAVAYFPASPPKSKRRGRRARYGDKSKLHEWFRYEKDFTKASSPVYGETGVTLRYYTFDLFWRKLGRLVRFVWVIHPTRGRLVLLCTDLTLNPLEIIRLYGWRFKIEVSFKQAIHTVGAYAYHFWMQDMNPIRRGDGSQHPHRQSERYRQAVRRKLAAYERHIQLGLIAQGLLHSSLRQLLEKMRAERPEELPEKPVMQVFECQKSIDRAAKLAGVKRITHHDLRHLFATRCIEAGVDVPTVSRWLGHQDGGALCMKTYGHLRDEHSQREALKVTF